jgi:hypothetical protein
VFPITPNVIALIPLEIEYIVCWSGNFWRLGKSWEKSFFTMSLEMTADLLEMKSKDFLVKVTEMIVLRIRINVAENPKIIVCD